MQVILDIVDMIPYSDFNRDKPRIDALAHNVEDTVGLDAFFELDAFYDVIVAEKSCDSKDYHHAYHNPQADTACERPSN
jgi:hypothetical protein